MGTSAVIQSQKTQGFCVADFATLSDERRSGSKIFPLFIWIKELCVRKFERLERSKLLGISQTIIASVIINLFPLPHFPFVSPAEIFQGSIRIL